MAKTGRKNRRREREKRAWLDRVRHTQRRTFRLLYQDRVTVPTDVVWHVLYLRVGWDDRALAELRRLGFATYRPVLLEERQRRGEPWVREQALFPRYAFVGLDPKNPRFQAVEQVDGVFGFIRTESRPATVEAGDLQSLSDRVTAIVPREPTYPSLDVPVGGHVRVTSGPFTSYEAVVDEVFADGRLRVLVDIFGRQTPVDCDVADLKAA